MLKNWSETIKRMRYQDFYSFKFFYGEAPHYNPGGTALKWVTGCGPKDPVSCLPRRSQDPHFSIFQFSRPYFHPSPPNCNSLEILSSKASKLEFSSKAQNGPNFRSRLHFVNIFSSQARVLNSIVVRSQAPLICSAFRSGRTPGGALT